MVSTIQVEERTGDELLMYVSELQQRLGRRVSFDEAIMVLSKEVRGMRESRAGLNLYTEA